MAWKKLISRGDHPVLFMEAVVNGIAKHTSEALKINFNFTKQMRHCGGTYFDEDEWNEYVKKLREKAKKDDSYFLRCAYNNYSKLDFLTVTAEQLSRVDVESTSKEELKEMFFEFMEAYNAIWTYAYFPFAVEEILQDIIANEISSRLKKIKKENKLQDYLLLFSYPKKETFSYKENVSLLKIAVQIEAAPSHKHLFKKPAKEILKEIDNYPIIKSLIDDHLFNYSWLNIYLFAGQKYTAEDIIERLKSLDNAKEKLENIEKKRIEVEEELKRIIQELGIDKKLLNIINLFSEYSYLRTYRIEKYGQIHSYLNPFVEKLAKKLGLEYEEFISMTLEEIGKEKFNKKELQERIKGHAILYEDEKLNVYSGKELNEFLKKVQEPVSCNIKKIEGTSINTGKASGIARVITGSYDKENLIKFKNGEILITTMTTPDFFSAIAKSAAVVTEEGGILCHAAILARELDKPCIVGVQDATRLIKTGDKIEVDAEKGIVRKIS